MTSFNTIKSSKDISNVFKSGRYFSNRFATFIVYDDKGDSSPSARVAFIAGKKYGGAVWRNSAKRRLREIYRELSKEINLGGNKDIILLAKPGLLEPDYSRVLKECKKTFLKISTGY